MFSSRASQAEPYAPLKKTVRVGGSALTNSPSTDRTSLLTTAASPGTTCPPLADLEQFHRAVFASVTSLARHGAPLDVVRSDDQGPSLRSEGFTVFPIKVIHHMQDYFFIEHDRDALQAACAGYAAESISSSMQNIWQHGHSFHKLQRVPPESGDVHAAIALKGLRVTGPEGNPLDVLVSLVTDAGPGIRGAANCMVDGVSNSMHGGQGCGMGWELRGSLVYVVRSVTSGWLVFDGFAFSKAPHREVNGFSQEAATARVDPVGPVNLPSPGIGCQKIFFSPAENCSDSDKAWLTEQITRALTEAAV